MSTVFIRLFVFTQKVICHKICREYLCDGLNNMLKNICIKVLILVRPTYSQADCEPVNMILSFVFLFCMISWYVPGAFSDQQTRQCLWVHDLVRIC